jgi:hypothetical protein
MRVTGANIGNSELRESDLDKGVSEHLQYRRHRRASRHAVSILEASTETVPPYPDDFPEYGVRNPRVLGPAKHGRERGPEDSRQLLRWKILVDEAQRLDERNGVHDAAQQSQRPPGVVRGKLQEPCVEEPPPTKTAS